MDTRSKILTLESALALQPPRPLALVSGFFDVLRAAHARDLAEVRRRAAAGALMAVVLPHPTALLSQRARAEMVAALRVIDYVLTINDADLDRIAAALHPAVVVRLEDADTERVHQLIAHVHRRQAR
jgi:bifunctional ADP-heptose synthase (sugar kinase/adenylyltransferase)